MYLVYIYIFLFLAYYYIIININNNYTEDYNNSLNPSTCFMCGAVLFGSLEQINLHIDQCLLQQNQIVNEEPVGLKVIFIFMHTINESSIHPSINK